MRNRYIRKAVLTCARVRIVARVASVTPCCTQHAKAASRIVWRHWAVAIARDVGDMLSSLGARGEAENMATSASPRPVCQDTIVVHQAQHWAGAETEHGLRTPDALVPCARH